MNFLEKDLEEIIYYSDRELLDSRGLYVTGIAKRQLKIGNYGVADMVTFTRFTEPNNFLEITVYELKKEKVGISAFLQAVNYIRGIHRYLETRNFKNDVQFRIVLIGNKVDTNSSFVYLENILPLCNMDASSFLSIYSYSYEIDGIKFKLEYGYKLSNEGF